MIALSCGFGDRRHQVAGDQIAELALDEVVAASEHDQRVVVGKDDDCLAALPGSYSSRDWCAVALVGSGEPLVAVAVSIGGATRDRDVLPNRGIDPPPLQYQ